MLQLISALGESGNRGKVYPSISEHTARFQAPSLVEDGRKGQSFGWGLILNCLPSITWRMSDVNTYASGDEMSHIPLWVVQVSQLLFPNRLNARLVPMVTSL